MLQTPDSTHEPKDKTTNSTNGATPADRASGPPYWLSAFVGLILVGILAFVLLSPPRTDPLHYMVVTLFAALCAGLLGYLISGNLKATGALPEVISGIKIEAVGGMALFVIVFLSFLPSKPKELLNVTGMVYTGTSERLGEPAAGVDISLVGTSVPGSTTNTQGYFRIENVPRDAANAKLQLHYPGRSVLVVSQSDKKEYWLDIPPVVWKALQAEKVDVQAVTSANAPAGTNDGTGRDFRVTCTIPGDSTASGWDGVEVEITLLGDGAFQEALVSIPGARLDEAQDRKIGAVIPVTPRDGIAPVFRIRARGYTDPVALKNDITIRYRFRPFPA